ncbi:uncharacterized protein TNCV_69961 [Trichonephila clavipes]|nr:uncharacterized protein TNCV_69961 [Trichonephila clavipes]
MHTSSSLTLIKVELLCTGIAVYRIAHIAARAGRDPMTVTEYGIDGLRTHQDGHIRVWRHRGERTLAACIHHRHTGSSTGVMIWGAVGYTSQSPLVHVYGTLNNSCYNSCVLRPVALPFIRAL